MRPGPKKPGESAAEYSARVKAMEERWKAGIGRPKTSGGTPSPVKTPGHVVSDTRGPNYPKNPVRSGETKTQYLDRVRSEKPRGMIAADPGSKELAARNAAARAAEQKAKARAAAMAAEKMKRDGSSSGGGRRDMGPGSGGAPVSGGRGIVKGLPTPKKSAPREKVDLRDTKGQRIKDRKPVLYSGSGPRSKPLKGKM